MNGATGVSGRQAVQVAKFLGAKRVIATGRDAKALEELRGLGADQVIALEQPEDTLREAFHAALRKDGGTQVVLDFLWGRTAELLLSSFARHGSGEDEPRLRFVQIGSISGQTVQLSAEWLRSSGVELLGSGLGSLSTAAILKSLRVMYDAYGEHRFAINVSPVPLEQVERAWTEGESGSRTVFTIS